MTTYPGFDATHTEINIDPTQPHRAVLTLTNDTNFLPVAFDVWHLIGMVGDMARALETMVQRPRVQAWMHDNMIEGMTTADVNTCIRKVLA